ncbi:MAG: pilin [bacterium]|nr:pilin [bacterium]
MQISASFLAYEPISKNTSDCLPPQSCCIYPKITELTCPGGVCSGESDALGSSLPVVCSGDFQSDFCDDYTSNCGQNQNSLMCQQTLINLTNNATVSACSGSSDLSGCLKFTVACSQDKNSPECQQFIAQGSDPNIVPAPILTCSKSSIFSDCLKGYVACSQDQNSSDCQKFIAKSTAEKGACSQNQTSPECQQFLAQNASSESLVPSPILACIGSSDFIKCLNAVLGGSLEKDTSKWLGLVPCTGFNKNTGELDCTLCSVFELIRRIIDWLVEFILAISVGFIIWAGISMMFSGGDPSGLTKAKEMLTTAIYGVALALGGWLIIGTLLGVLTGSDKIMPWNKITCKSEPIKLSPGVPKLSANCTSAGGICQNKTTTECVGGSYEEKLCSGSTNIQCCVPRASKKTCASVRGKCQNNSLSCDHDYIENLCPGTAANIQCCVPFSQAEIDSAIQNKNEANKEAMIKEACASPDNQAACECRGGTCQTKGSCGYANPVITGACPGDGQQQCCKKTQ